MQTPIVQKTRHGYDRAMPRTPSPRVWSILSGLSLASALMGAPADSPAPGAPVPHRAPNIIFILADDMGYGDPSIYGQTRIQTPNIDRLAGEGIRFTDGYAGAPVCAPSRCTLMTGVHDGHTRVRDNFALAAGTIGHKKAETIRRASLTGEDRTVADYLKAAGYTTGLMGKWHLDGYDPAAVPTRHGFDEFKGWLTQIESTQGVLAGKALRQRAPDRHTGKRRGKTRAVRHGHDNDGLYRLHPAAPVTALLPLRGL